MATAGNNKQDTNLFDLLLLNFILASSSLEYELLASGQPNEPFDMSLLEMSLSKQSSEI